jgi:hypothetical protein
MKENFKLCIKISKYMPQRGQIVPFNVESDYSLLQNYCAPLHRITCFKLMCKCVSFRNVLELDGSRLTTVNKATHHYIN